MPETISLTHILILLTSAVLTVSLFQRIGLSSVLGYLFAGAIVGPWGLSIIYQVSEIQHIAEFGVIFLLFIIGIELNLTKLWSMRRLVFGLGFSQVVLTGSVLTSIALIWVANIGIAIVIGFGLALSSTAFVLQILSERNSLQSVTGRISFAILLLQDLFVLPFLALISFMSQDMALLDFIQISLLTNILLITSIILVGRFILTPILMFMASKHNTEVFIAASILVVLGTAWLVETMGLSMALGAFLAGLMLSDSHYRHQIVADIHPFRGILLGLFFMSVGMSIDLGLFASNALSISALVIGLLAIKIAIAWIICRVSKITNGAATHIALLLSQSGEFGFILFGLMLTSNLITDSISQVLILVIAISMTTTPLMAMAGEKIEKILDKKNTPDNLCITSINDQPFVVLIGFGRMGRRVAEVLKAGNIPYLALDNDAKRVKRSRENGFSVIYGDASRYDILNRMGADKALVFVITIDNMSTAEQLIHIIHHHYNKTPIYARGHDKKYCEKLHESGASFLVSETLEASLTLGSEILRMNNISDKKISTIMEDLRKLHCTHTNGKDS